MDKGMQVCPTVVFGLNLMTLYVRRRTLHLLNRRRRIQAYPDMNHVSIRFMNLSGEDARGDNITRSGRFIAFRISFATGELFCTPPIGFRKQKQQRPAPLFLPPSVVRSWFIWMRHACSAGLSVVHASCPQAQPWLFRWRPFKPQNNRRKTRVQLSTKQKKVRVENRLQRSNRISPEDQVR